MRAALIALPILAAFAVPAQPRERSEKSERLLIAFTAAPHCDLKVQMPLASKYYASFGFARSDSADDELELVAFVTAYVQAAEKEWKVPAKAAERCADLVRWFGDSGTEMQGLVSGTGKPTN